jgi:hypothetical protein
LCSLYSFTPMSWLVFVSISICVIFSIALFIDRTIYLEMRLSIVKEIMFGYIILSTMFFYHMFYFYSILFLRCFLFEKFLVVFDFRESTQGCRILQTTGKTP